MNERIEPLEIQKYIKLAQENNKISLAPGLPDLSILPLDKLKHAYAELMTESVASFQYKGPEESLKEKIQAMMLEKSVQCGLDEILITNGAQQALYLTANLWLKNYGSLIIEEFVYPGFLQIATMYELNYLTVPSIFNQGIDLNYLEIVLKKHKPLPYLYIVSNGHNPQGITLSNKNRKDLAYLADKYNFIIIEDDPYGYLTYTNETYLPLRAFTTNAIYISSFSKIIAPALRIGWIIGEPEMIQKLEQLKDMNDIYVSNLNQITLNTLLTKHHLPDMIAPQKVLYQHKRDCMVAALRQYIKVPFQYVIPQHGMFIWLVFLEVNIEKNRDLLFEKSNVLFIPGSAFSINKNPGVQAMRLNFTSPSFENIELAIQRLGQALLEINYFKDLSTV